jgi:hypothetical protein
MGDHFPAMSGTGPFVGDQTVTIGFTGRLRPWGPALLATLSQTPQTPLGGTTVVLRHQTARH